MRSILLLGTVLAICTLGASATAAPADLVSAKLLSDVKSIQPGRAFHVGVLLTIRPGWHVYWQNPGDSGVPTTVQLTLPAGLKQGPVQFPVPQEFKAGNAVSLGYADTVLLVTTIAADKDLAAGANVEIDAKATWLCCNEQCVPGKAALKLQLPVNGADAQPDNAELFGHWTAHLPVELGSDSAPATGNVTVQSTGKDSRTFIIQLKWKQSAPAGLRVLAIPEDALSLGDINIQTHDSTTRIVLPVTVLQGQQVRNARMPVVVAFDTSDGPKGVALSVPTDSLK